MAQVKDKKLMLLASHGKPDLCSLPPDSWFDKMISGLL
jgi:hypothetical protein